MTVVARRCAAVALAAGACTAALGAAGPLALLPFADLARAAAADTSVAVAFVVDFGGGTPPVVGCVKVPAGTNGYQALADFTAQEQQQAPTYNASGLLCSINGTPSSGCGQAVNGGYVYWSYWHGSSGAWQYANTGAFAAVQPGDVEGWRFENPGRGNPTDPPPGASPSYGAICGPVTAATTTTGPSGSSGGSSPSPGSASGGSGGPPSPSAATGPGGSAAPPAPGPSAGSVGSTLPGSRTPGTGTSGVGSSATPSTTRPASAGGAQSLRALRPTAARPNGSGAAPLAIGGGLVVILAGLAFWRWRKRPHVP